MSDMNASEIWTGKANILHKYKTGLDDIINDKSKKNLSSDSGVIYAKTLEVFSPIQYLDRHSNTKCFKAVLSKTDVHKKKWGIYFDDSICECVFSKNQSLNDKHLV